MAADTIVAASGRSGVVWGATHLQGYSIWRKDADGQWRCVVDIANEAPGATAPVT